MGLIMAEGRELTKASQVFKTILRLIEARFGQGSPQFIEMSGILGMIHYQENDVDEALRRFCIVEEWQSSNLPADHPDRRLTGLFMSELHTGKAGKEVWV